MTAYEFKGGEMSTRYILFILSFFVVSASAANDHLKQESYWDIQAISNPIISPKGKNIIFSKRYIDKKNDAFISDLWIMSSDGSEKRFFVKGSTDTHCLGGTRSRIAVPGAQHVQLADHLCMHQSPRVSARATSEPPRYLIV